MTRKGPSKAADKSFGDGRFAMANAFLRTAQNEAELADDSDRPLGDRIMAQPIMILSC